MACLQRARAGLSVIKLQILYHNKLFIRGQVTVIGCVDMQSCADIILCLIYCTVGHNAMRCYMLTCVLLKENMPNKMYNAPLIMESIPQNTFAS